MVASTQPRRPAAKVAADAIRPGVLRLPRHSAGPTRPTVTSSRSGPVISPGQTTEAAQCAAPLRPPGEAPLSHLQRVEVLGRYSNRCDPGKRIERVLEIPLSELTTLISKPLRQVHRRLPAGELDELAKAYRAGATLSQLSDRFRKHRTTISTDLERRGVSRRYRMVEGERLHLAIQSYQDGKSVVSIGKELGVAGETVRKALIQAGVKLRPRRGRDY